MSNKHEVQNLIVRIQEYLKTDWGKDWERAKDAYEILNKDLDIYLDSTDDDVGIHKAEYYRISRFSTLGNTVWGTIKNRAERKRFTYIQWEKLESLSGEYGCCDCGSCNIRYRMSPPEEDIPRPTIREECCSICCQYDLCFCFLGVNSNQEDTICLDCLQYAIKKLNL